ncbi:(Lipo)protein [Seminavis robusta]|uniref:(Lipo)protein n=1 Tax=Seminavis robusta TaxID=568900 RepID=A0A9N8EN70_9STRA|nr:(Lipo)protein [Seminavis robusta]|eukprot:Sro1269_g257890.1 (Lipo)protein (653) ;mRNA; r:22690-24648
MRSSTIVTTDDNGTAGLQQYLDHLNSFEGPEQSVGAAGVPRVADKAENNNEVKEDAVEHLKKRKEGDNLSGILTISPSSNAPLVKALEQQRISTLIPTPLGKCSESNNQNPESSYYVPRDQDTVEVLNTSSIQPLPLRQNNNVDLASQSEAGAYAIQSPFFRQAQVQSINDDTDDLENPNSPPLQLDNSADSLVEAHLVEETETEIVHAEKVPIEPSHPNRRNRIILFIAVLIIVALLVVLGITMRRGAKEAQSKADTETTSKIRNQGNESSVASNDTITIIESGSTSTSTSKNSTEGKQQRCIRTTEELYQTITKYWEDTSTNSNVSIMYGWPMNKWCGISNITIFNHLFKVSKQRVDYDSIMPANLTDKAMITASNMVEDIGSWDMRRARRIEFMFEGLQNVSESWGIQKWDTTSLISMKGVFKNTSWTLPMLNLSSWDTSKVQNMAQLFLDSNVQRPGIAQWDTAELQTMFRFADGNPYFNENLSNWNTGSVTTMQKAFKRCTNFDQDLSGWNTMSVKQLSQTFWGATSFHSNIGQWDVSNVETLFGTFKESNFNNDITSWNVAKVTDMQQTFQHNEAFNQDISAWNVSQVTDLQWTFAGASSFSQDLCAWRFSLPTGIPTKNMFQNSGCPNTSDPVSIEEGPFCFNCN